MIVFVLVLAGFLLRIYNLENWASFDYDQKIASWWIKSLLVDHKFSLVGQEVSLGGIFIGPFYYYFLAPFYWLSKLDPIAGNIAVSLVSIFTLILIYKVGTLMFNPKVGIIALFLYAFSSQVNFYDRTTAPSNLLMILSLLTVYFLIEKREHLMKWLGLGIIGGISFSVHPTAMFLIPQTTLFLLIKKKINRFFLIVIILTVFGLLPLVIFDFRHEHMLSQRLFKVGAAVPDVKLLFNATTLAQMWLNFFNPLKIFWLEIISTFTGVFFLRWLIKIKADKTLWIIWVGIPLIILSIYSFHVPEYYFLPAIPLIIIFTAAFLVSLPRTICVSLMVLFGLTNLYVLGIFENKTSLFYKKQAVEYITSQSRNFDVWYDCDLGLNNGYDYLFYYFKNEPKSSGMDKYTIVSPAKRSSLPGQVFGNIKVIKNE